MSQTVIVTTIIVPAYIYFDIPGCYYFSSIFTHRLEVHRSAESSAVGLECIALRAMLTVRHQFYILHRFLMLPSTDAG